MLHLLSFPLVPFYTTPTNPSPTTNLFEHSNLNPISTQSLSFPISFKPFFSYHIFFTHQPFVFWFLKLHPLILISLISFTKLCHWVCLLSYTLFFSSLIYHHITTFFSSIFHFKIHFFTHAHKMFVEIPQPNIFLGTFKFLVSQYSFV